MKANSVMRSPSPLPILIIISFFFHQSSLAIGSSEGPEMFGESISHQEFTHDSPVHRKLLHEVHSGSNPISNSGPRKMWFQAQLRKNRNKR